MDCRSASETAGWANQAAIDLMSVDAIGEVLEAREKERKLSRQMKNTCVMLIQNMKKISPRLRSYFEHTGGVHVQWAKVGWEAITEAAKSHSYVISQEWNRAQMESFAKIFDDLDFEKPHTVFDACADIHDTASDAVVAFATCVRQRCR